jgi:phage terminase small subunit
MGLPPAVTPSSGTARPPSSFACTGTLVNSAKGNAVKNPACQMARDHPDLMTRLTSRFGLIPGDRAQIKYDYGPASGYGPDDILSMFA